MFGDQMKSRASASNLKSEIFNLKSALCLLASVAALSLLAACDVELRKSDSQLGLNPQQAAGRRVYDERCDRCHAPYSSRGKKGPSMKGVFKKQFLSQSGLPANDDRVAEIVRYGRNNMPGFGQVLNQRQVEDLLAYLHTL
jgi:mono/diheme cytochrome c family protein